MFIPNAIALYSAMTGYNKFAEPTFATPVSVRIGVVHLASGAQKTSVRTDSSASRGNAEERTVAAKILLKVPVEPVMGHKLVHAGKTLRALSIEPRWAVTGRLDHYECEYEVWI